MFPTSDHSVVSEFVIGTKVRDRFHVKKWYFIIYAMCVYYVLYIVLYRQGCFIPWFTGMFKETNFPRPVQRLLVITPTLGQLISRISNRYIFSAGYVLLYSCFLSCSNALVCFWVIVGTMIHLITPKTELSVDQGIEDIQERKLGNSFLVCWQ